MTRTPTALAATLATITLSLLAACASTPLAPTAAASNPDCAALAADIAKAADAQRAAERKRNDAWKSVLPVAAVARFGQGSVEASQSQQRLDDLRSQVQRLGCREPDGVGGNGIRTSAPSQGLRVSSSLQ